jgi:hypothetical protein
VIQSTISFSGSGLPGDSGPWPAGDQSSLHRLAGPPKTMQLIDVTRNGFVGRTIALEFHY